MSTVGQVSKNSHVKRHMCQNTWGHIPKLMSSVFSFHLLIFFFFLYSFMSFFFLLWCKGLTATIYKALKGKNIINLLSNALIEYR